MKEWLEHWLARDRATVIEVNNAGMRLMQLQKKRKHLEVRKCTEIDIETSELSPGEVLDQVKEKIPLSSGTLLVRFAAANILYKLHLLPQLDEGELRQHVLQSRASLLPPGMNPNDVAVAATSLDSEGSALFSIVRKQLAKEWEDAVRNAGFTLGALVADAALSLPALMVFDQNLAQFEHTINIVEGDRHLSFHLKMGVVRNFSATATTDPNEANSNSADSVTSSYTLGRVTGKPANSLAGKNLDFATSWFPGQNPNQWFPLFALGYAHFYGLTQVADLRADETVAAVAATQEQNKVMTMAAAATGILISLWLLLAVAGYFVKEQKAQKQYEMSGLLKRLELIDSLKTVKSSLKEEVRLKQAILGKRSSVSQTLEAVAGAMPKGAWLRSFKTGEPQDPETSAGLEDSRSPMEIAGLSLAEPLPTQLLAGIEQLDIFARSELELLEFVPAKIVKKKTKRHARDLYKFRIRIWDRQDL